METKTRSWVKSVVWRVIGIVLLGAISWLVTDSWKEVTVITAAFHLLRFILYYVHERIWAHIRWGKIEHPLADLPVIRELEPEDKRKIAEQLRGLGYLG